MQRRAAAIYAAIFIVVAAGSYAMVGVAQEPTISLQNPDRSLSSGDEFRVNGRTYTVSVSEGSAEFTWVNQSARHTATLENDSTVPPTDVRWEGQTARNSATLSNNTAVSYNGSEYRLVIPNETDPSSFTLQSGNDTQEFAVGDQLAYRGNQTTVMAVTPRQVTLVWGDPYRVLIPNETDPSSFTLRQELNTSEILQNDPAVENQSVTRADGREYVVYKANGTTRPLDEYLPQPERREFSEGDTLAYQGNDTAIGNVSSESVPLSWTGPRATTVSASEGENVTLNGQTFVAHFPDAGTVELESNYDAYARQGHAIETYNERISGLWAVSILSSLAAIMIIGLAYMPSRY